MKFILLLVLGMFSVKFGYCQKKNIEYQYFREGKSYYAFELFKDAGKAQHNEFLLNFTATDNFKKIDKISVKAGEVEVKLKFKARDEVIKSDNPEQKFYPIIFDAKELNDKNLGCEAQIVFKLDNGASYTLPFSACLLK